MNIYFLSQTENNNYDTYDSCVVIAETEEEAKLIHPSGNTYNTYFKDINKWCSELDYKRYKQYYDYYMYSDYSWCSSPDAVMVEYLGEFKGNLNDYPSRIICASFNAG